MNAHGLLNQSIKAGGALVAIHRLPCFQEFARSSLHRLVRTGKIPALRIGRSYYTTTEVAIAALNETSHIPAIPGEHEAAVASLSRKGIGRRKAAKGSL